MKYPEKLPRIAKIPFYFQYFRRKHREGIKKITAQEISLDNGIKYPSGTVNTDLSTFIGNIGYKKYGYNIVALCNSFAGILDLKEPINVGVIGDPIVFIDKEELSNVNMNVDCISINSNLEDYSLLVLTQKISADFLIALPDTIKAIYDFSNNDLSYFKGKSMQFDLASVLLDIWFQTTNTYNSSI